jgi:hypothetical protein
MLSVPSLGRSGVEKISNARPDASGFLRIFEYYKKLLEQGNLT